MAAPHIYLPLLYNIHPIPLIMKYSIVLFLAAFLLINCSNAQSPFHTLSLEPGQTSPKAKIDQVSWIQGAWAGEAFGGTVEEVWNPPSAGTMMGMFKSEKDGAVNFYELMTRSWGCVKSPSAFSHNQ